jgi:hypothetical protein
MLNRDANCKQSMTSIANNNKYILFKFHFNTTYSSNSNPRSTLLRALRMDLIIDSWNSKVLYNAEQWLQHWHEQLTQQLKGGPGSRSGESELETLDDTVTSAELYGFPRSGSKRSLLNPLRFSLGSSALISLQLTIFTQDSKKCTTYHLHHWDVLDSSLDPPIHSRSAAVAAAGEEESTARIRRTIAIDRSCR